MFSKKKDLSYYYIHLNKNRLLIKYSTLFNIGAKIHITWLIKEFNTSIYILVSLLLINIASREAKLLGYSINIFEVRKLLDRGNI